MRRRHPVRRAYASAEPPDRYACGAPSARSRACPSLRVVPPNEFATTLVVLDLIGIFVFAVTGALVAVRKNLDLFAALVLAGVTGLGGGFIRDVLIGATPPAALADWRYLLVPVARRSADLRLPPDHRPARARRSPCSTRSGSRSSA